MGAKPLNSCVKETSGCVHIFKPSHFFKYYQWKWSQAEDISRINNSYIKENFMVEQGSIFSKKHLSDKVAIISPFIIFEGLGGRTRFCGLCNLVT